MLHVIRLIVNKYPARAQIYHRCHLIKKNMVLNSQNAWQVAILDLIRKLESKT
jgi:hypothetical protein